MHISPIDLVDWATATGLYKGTVDNPLPWYYDRVNISSFYNNYA